MRGMRKRRLVAAVAVWATLWVFYPGYAQESAGADSSHIVPLFPAANDAARQGFVRVINHSARAGEVEVRATDDHGMRVGPTTLAIDARETVHFNSTDLELGNGPKGLPDGVGSGMGDWRLNLRSGLDIEVLSYIRTPADGFLTSMHDLVPVDGDGIHRVATFNPGSNWRQRSLLRVINPGNEAARVTVEGIDGDGAAGASNVELTVAAGAAVTVDAQRLESGGSGLAGALGDGASKWRLAVRANRPIHAMSLLSSPTGHLTNLSTAPANRDGDAHVVPLFPAASDPLGRQGFVRVTNHSGVAGQVAIAAFDDSERDYGISTLALDAGQTAHFNSDDLEGGNRGKGLTGGTGAGEGDWRLSLESALDIEVLAYIRTRDGFLTAMHDTVPRAGRRHRVPTFNPGSNTNQVSGLRLVNGGTEPAAVTVEGIDGAGTRSSGTVSVSVPAGASRTLRAQELETGGDGVGGALGDGVGKWQLGVESDVPIAVMSLLSNPTGHLTNLSTAPALDFAPSSKDVFDDRFAHRRIVGDVSTDHLDFLSGGRFRETWGASTREGTYAYIRTGRNRATVVFNYDDGDRCTYELSFQSRTAGNMISCDEGDDESSWHLIETPATDPQGGAAVKSFDLFDLDVNTSPEGIVHVDGRFHVVNSATYARKVFAYAENGERDAAADFDLDGDNDDPVGIAHADGRFHVVDEDDGKVYAYAENGERDAAADFDLDGDNAHPRRNRPRRRPVPRDRPGRRQGLRVRGERGARRGGGLRLGRRQRPAERHRPRRRPVPRGRLGQGQGLCVRRNRGARRGGGLRPRRRQRRPRRHRPRRRSVPRGRRPLREGLCVHGERRARRGGGLRLGRQEQ